MTLRSVLYIFAYLLLFYMTGSIECGLLKLRENHLFRLVYGYFLYFFLFFLVALPMKLLRMPLSVLALSWCVVLAFLAAVFIRQTAAAFFSRNRSQRREDLVREEESALRSVRKGKAYAVIYCAAAFLLILAMVLLYNSNQENGAWWDASYYIGDVSTSVFHNSISGYDPYTGAYLEDLKSEYQFEVLQNHSAVVCFLTGIPPLIEVKTVLASVHVILFYSIIVLFAQAFFAGRPGLQLLFLLAVEFIDFWSYNTHVRAQILLYRAYEGKAVLANILIYGMLYLLVRRMRAQKEKAWWWMLFLSAGACCGLNMTSLLLVPVLAMAVLVPYILGTRQWKWLLWSGLSFSPFVVIGIVYIGMLM